MVIFARSAGDEEAGRGVLAADRGLGEARLGLAHGVVERARLGLAHGVVERARLGLAHGVVGLEKENQEDIYE